ncbi:MAG: nucleotide-binding protein [Acidimicrobiales bacterium]|nr:nucleotide-binding protein [Acidimicrobiales bacterium]
MISQKIADENAGAPMNRLLVADALGIKPASSNFKYLLSSSRMYGLTEGTEKATEVSLTPLGKRVTRSSGPERMAALRQAALTIPLYREFFERFNGNKLPSPDMLRKILVADFGVPADRAEEAAGLVVETGEFIGVLRQISGSTHVLMDAVPDSEVAGSVDGADDAESAEDGLQTDEPVGNVENEGPGSEPPTDVTRARPKPIFVGHGKNTGPLEKLEKILAGFQIPYKVAVSEPNLGRPIPAKVRDIMLECGSAILIFTKDQRFTNDEGAEIWRPSENVAHELGACSFAYEDRVVIFKEQGIDLPTNFSSIGYIEFEENGIAAKTAELLQELIGFGLVKITPTT